MDLQTAQGAVLVDEVGLDTRCTLRIHHVIRPCCLVAMQDLDFRWRRR